MNIVVLISGNGSNLQAIIDAIASGKLNAEIKAVISDQAKAYGLIRAEQAGVQTEILSAKEFHNREDYDKHLLELLKKYNPELIILAGFMRILTPVVITAYRGRMINIHPALLPKYRGLQTHERALAAGDNEHGITIHFVTNDLDAGPNIAQAKLHIITDETPLSLKQRIQQLEHQLYPVVIQWFAEKRIKLKAEEVYLDDQLLSPTGKQVEVLEKY